MITFFSKVKGRGHRCGWQEILSISEDAIADPTINLHDLLNAYGEITLEQINIHSHTYITVHNRSAQNSMQLYHCLTNSLSEEGMSKVTIWEEQ